MLGVWFSLARYDGACAILILAFVQDVAVREVGSISVAIPLSQIRHSMPLVGVVVGQLAVIESGEGVIMLLIR